MPDKEQILIALLNSYAKLFPASLHELVSQADYSIFDKDAYLVKEDKNDEREYFLLEGLMHCCNIAEDGRTVTTDILYAPVVIVPHFARTLQRRSIFSIQALTACVAAHIPVSVFDKLRYAHADIGAFGNAVVEKELSRHLKEDTIFRSCNARQRLLLMRERYPGLENMIPHHIIASYLGITPVSFSRLRAELATQD